MGSPDTMAAARAPLYLFLDEGGDLNFSPTGTRFFTMTSVAASRPFPWGSRFQDLRFDLIEEGLEIDRFHASEDRQAVRDRVFAIIQTFLDHIRADSIIVEKCKTGPSLRADNRFYPEVLGYLLRYVLNGAALTKISEAIVITDTLPISKKRKAVEKAIKETMAKMLPTGVRYRVLHQPSASSCGLQVADYFNWAVFRAWTSDDRRSLDPIRRAIKSQFDIFEKGVTKWY